MAILARPGFLPHVIAADGAREIVRADPTCEDKARLTALYLEHGTRIHRFLRDLLGDAALASDATQETFVRAYKKLSAFDESGRIVPWLFGIARNVSLELRKARFRAGRHLVSVSGEVPDGVSRAPSPECDYLGREAVRIVGVALARLPEERRAMLLLRLDHGLSYDDIAVTMSCSLAKVKVEIFRAREVLRRTMAEYEQR